MCREQFNLLQSCQQLQPGASLALCQFAPGEMDSEGGIAAAGKELTAIEEWPDV